jgi:hypothetical protein
MGQSRSAFLAWQLAALAIALVFHPLARADDAERGAKPRLLVLTDIGEDPDDQQSMIRLMLYTNEFELEGLIATASGFPGERRKEEVRPHLIREIVEAYGQVRGNLVRHAEGYPTADELLARIKSGSPTRGAIGEGHDTEGSRWIIDAVDKTDDRPLNIAIWGGQTDFAQALWRVRNDRGEDGLAKFMARFRTHDIGDQDDLAERLWKEFPGMFYILDRAPRDKDKREGVLRGMYLGGDESLVSREWMETNIRNDHGPLGALYPPHTWTEPNPHGAIKEGDTPSWFYFLPHGLNDPQHPEWGGWGGRFTKTATKGVFRDAADTVGDQTHPRATVWRWRRAYQADFQARLDWCVADEFAQANHNPRAVMNGDDTQEIVRISAKPGETVRLSADGSIDPDKDQVQSRWFIYPEAGTCRDEIALMSSSGLATSFTAPDVKQAQTVHVVLEVRDDGAPNLSAFRRVVVTVDGP